MSDYWKRLKNHPGWPSAMFMSLAGLVAGLSREDGNWWVGLITLVFWVPVLLTAREKEQ